MSEPLLRMERITKSFGPVTVFKDVDLELRGGEVLSIVGENGAGKSTLMNVLSGVYPVGSFSGAIRIDGEAASFSGPSDSQRAGIEMIRQEISLHPDLSVAENLYLGRLPLRRGGLVDWKGAFAGARAELAKVGLETPPEAQLRDLNTSQQQLVAIAKALARRMKILVLDEPTSALTVSETEKLLSLVRGLADSGIACIYISHHLEEVFEVSDRIMVLRDGAVVAGYSKGDFDRRRVVEAMVGRKLETMYPKASVSPGREVLRVESLSVPHPMIPSRNIVEGVSFSVRAGEIVGLAGLVGAGRSETVNAIFGAQALRSGKVFVEGRLASIRTTGDAVAAGIGLVPEERKRNGLIAAMDVMRNMTIASLGAVSRLGVVSDAKERSIASRFFERMRVKAQGLDASVTSISGGNQQKVVLAKWLMKDLKVLILDEPTRGVDVGAKVDIYEIISELVRSGLGIVLVSSDLPELLGLSDRVIVLGKGRVQAELDRSEATPESVIGAATGT